MTTIYRVRDGVRYAEVSCIDCGSHNAVSEDALDFYYNQSPALPYYCPACRLRRDPQALLYGQAHQLWPAAI